jgi:hypothetical protein
LVYTKQQKKQYENRSWYRQNPVARGLLEDVWLTHAQVLRFDVMATAISPSNSITTLGAEPMDQ